MTSKFEKVLVTGAGGFIGSHLVETLVSRGAEVTAFVHYNSRSDVGLLRDLPPETLRKIKIYFGELKDFHSVYEAAKNQEVIFHLGALIGIPYSYLHPRDVVETNVLGTLNVLMAAKELKTRRVIHTSTSEVYGTARMERITEAHPLQGQSPYSASKIGADKIVESFFNTYALPVVTIRPFNTYGPRQSMRAIIPTVIGQALFQEQIRVGSLEPVRDFTYVQDTADAFICAAQRKGIEGKVMNLGTDTEISIREILNTILKLLEKEKMPIVSEMERMRPKNSEVLRLRSDNTYVREQLGWEPKIFMEEGLRRTIQWVRSQPEEYRKNYYVV